MKEPLLLLEGRERRREVGSGTKGMFQQFRLKRDGAKSTQEGGVKTKPNQVRSDFYLCRRSCV